MALVTIATVLCAVSVAAALPDTSAQPPIVGAIRWDAYWSSPGQPAFEEPNFGIVTRTTTGDMSPSKWHYRVPFFGREVCP